MTTVRITRLILIALTLAALAPPAHAADTYWQHDPAEPADWSDPANWTAGVPSDSDNAYIDNGGTASITSDVDTSVRLYVGDKAEGTVAHTSGTVSVDRLDLGYSEGGVGRYELTGDAMLNGHLSLGERGNGTFLQTGGTANLPVLDLGGADSAGEAYYLLQSGILNIVAGSYPSVYVRDGGLFEQTGGTCTTRYGVIGDGEIGGATFRLSAGTHTVTNRVFVGSEYGRPNEALFDLSGTGRLEADRLQVGRDGAGRFTQSGGQCAIVDFVRVYATDEVGDAVYELLDGELSAKTVSIGYETSSSKVGTFVQQGGTLASAKMIVGPGSRFEFADGQMAFNGGFVNYGTFEFLPGGGTLELAAGSTLDLSKGALANIANARINAAADTLVMFPAGIDPATDLAGYTSGGVTHVVGTTMAIPAEQDIVAFGTIDGHVRCQGSLRVPELFPGHKLVITRGLDVLPGGSADLGHGALTVGNLTSGMSGTSLDAWEMYIGVDTAAQFVHSAGQTSVENELTIGSGVGADGTLVVEGGELSAGPTYVGIDGGVGHVQHTGGLLTCTESGPYSAAIIVGSGEGSDGTYELSGSAELNAVGMVYVGSSGHGEFLQTGGTLVAEGVKVAGSGDFIQTGGNVVSASLKVYGQGTWTIGGSATITAETVLASGSGPGFVQTAGQVTSSGQLRLGGDYGSSGRYELHGGELNTGDTRVEKGTFEQTGGSHQTGFLQVDSQGRYVMAGGSLRITAGWQHEGEMDFLHGSAAITVNDATVVNMADASISNAENASLSIGKMTLTLFPKAFDPAAVFGNFSSGGIVHLAGTPLVIPAGYDLSYRGDFTDPVVCSGSLSAFPEEAINLNGGIAVLQGGYVDAGMGKPIVDGTTGSIQEGELRARYLNVGLTGAGQFVQDGGANTLAALRVGYHEGSEGTYALKGSGRLECDYVAIGWQGTGSFAQSSGDVDVYWISLGAEGGVGSYEFQGGRIDTVDVFVGSRSAGENSSGPGFGRWLQTGGELHCYNIDVNSLDTASSVALSGGTISSKWQKIDGVFRHTGGKNILLENGELDLGLETYESGVYELSGSGEVSTDRLRIGYWGTGLFTQSGGSVAVAKVLNLGCVGPSNGQYILNAGTMWAENVIVGDDGTGYMEQNGGEASVGDMYIGNRCSVYCRGDGTYVLNGGILAVQNERIGHYEIGRFTQTGGSHTVLNEVSMGYGNKSEGSYTMAGGTLSVGGVIVGGEGVGSFSITNADADIAINGKLAIGPKGSFAAVPGATVRMDRAHFSNECTDPAALAGLANLRMLFTSSFGLRSFEVAGEDVGRVLAGLEGNFALGTLRLGAEEVGKVRLVDLSDNQPNWEGREALYVHNLTIGAGSELYLNGLNLYYLDASIDPGASVIPDGGTLAPLFVPGTPPVADAGGPYTLDSGQTLTLNAGRSEPMGAELASYLWDLNDDGVFETDAGAALLSIAWADLRSRGVGLLGEHDIHLQVTDAIGVTDTAATTLTILADAVLTYNAETGHVSLDCGEGLIGVALSSAGGLLVPGACTAEALIVTNADTVSFTLANPSGLLSQDLGPILPTGLDPAALLTDLTVTGALPLGTTVGFGYIIPEPATLALLAMGALAVLGRRRR